MEENNEKEIKINVPAGYEIDRENSTFECIKFKKKESRFGDYDGSYFILGFYIDADSSIVALDSREDENDSSYKNVFECKDAAISALAFAQISQIRRRETDRYGRIPNWNEDFGGFRIIFNTVYGIDTDYVRNIYTRLDSYLIFDTLGHAELFLKENTQLVKEYFMMD